MIRLLRVAPLFLCLSACGAEALNGSPSALDQLERLAFVPPGNRVLPIEGPPVRRAAAAPPFERVLRLFFGPLLEPVLRRAGTETTSPFRSFSIRAPLLVDRFEVTRADWLRWLSLGEAPSSVRTRTRADTWPAEYLNRPATFMTWGEARAFADWRGMRLLTTEEWICVAVESRKHCFPWGAEWQASIANTLELGLGRACAVGTYPSGNTALGGADLLGNVWEWAADRLTGAEETPGDPRVSVMGGSFLTWASARRLFREGRFLEEPRHPDSRSTDVGLRCAIEAESFLFERAAGAERGEEARERLLAVGRRWGAGAVPWLEDWAARPGAPAALATLLEGARP